MATQTPNLGLVKPAGSDYVLVGDLNQNSDTLDSKIGNLAGLNTADKSSLVGAINEARTTGGENAPYVGDNGNWFEWDTTTSQYIDTGVPATGDAAGFGAPTATANTLPAGSAATVSVTASGSNAQKVFAFEFGIPRGVDGTGAGDMTKAQYDPDNNGIVNNSQALDGHPASYFAVAPVQKNTLDTPVIPNTEYRLGTIDSPTLSIQLPTSGEYEVWIRFVAGEGLTGLTFTGGTAVWMGVVPVISAGKTYELSIKDGYVMGVGQSDV